ncbi:MAG TPA: zf-TFIIB domain-containing protein [Aggregicoccus sp.]|nr:zf-TFIIB domain-containing protein [Aggregicoccus sp.]
MSLPAMIPELRCPRCPDQRLQRLRTLRGELDHCSGCRGHWVCGVAFSQAAAPVAEWARRPRPADHCLQGLHVLAPGQELCGHCPQPRLDCPSCAGRLTPVGVAGVVVDICARCPGVWLDAGELASLKRAREEAPLRRELPIFLPVPSASKRRLYSAVDEAGDALEVVELGFDAVGLVSDGVDFVLGALASLAE